MATKKELEQRIQILEKENKILSDLLRTVRSDGNDIDLVANSGKTAMLFRMNGTYAVQVVPLKNAPFKNVRTIEEAVKHFMKIQGASHV